jgi:hypothetical protein
MGTDEWLEGEVSFLSRKGSALEGSDTSHPNIHNECVPIAQNTV